MIGGKKRIVGIDFGLRRLGVAISDESKSIASSLGVLHAGKTNRETAQLLVDFLRPYSLEKVIVGYPIHLNGKIGFLADEVKDFTVHLQNAMSCEIVLMDERLTTVQAEKSLKEAGMRRKKRSQVIDAVSAIILLQSYLGY